MDLYSEFESVIEALEMVGFVLSLPRGW